MFQHAVLGVVEPPTGTHLNFALDAFIIRLEVRDCRSHQVEISRVKVVSDEFRQFIRQVHCTKQIVQSIGYVRLILDGIEAGIRA